MRVSQCKWVGTQYFARHGAAFHHITKEPRSLKPRYSFGALDVSLFDVQLGYALFVCISLALVPRELGGSLHIPSSFRPARDAVT